MYRLSRSESRALVMAVCAMLLFAGVAVFIRHCGRKEVAYTLSPEEIARADSLDRRIQDMERRYDRRGGKTLVEGELFAFDPNQADSATLLRLGFRPWQIRNMMRYRMKNGRWRSAEDFRRLYGLSEEEYNRLRPYIRISSKDRKDLSDREVRHYYGTPKGARVDYEPVEKYSEGTLVPLNEADTFALKRIPGIGSYYAGKIVRYRERLGGFVSVSQINEVEGLPAGAIRWFSLGGSASPRTIRINHATFKQLVSHPYLSYEQTKVIVNHIRKYGPLRGWNDLRLYKEFGQQDFSRLSPYFTFD